MSKIRELEQHLKTVRKREAKAREELDILRKAQKQNKFVLDDKCEQLQIDNAELQDKLTEVSIIYRAWDLSKYVQPQLLWSNNSAYKQPLYETKYKW